MAGGEAEGVLEFAARRNHVRYGPAEVNGRRSEPARSPQHRVRPRKTRVTESSTAVRIGRSWVKNRSAKAFQPL